MKTSRCITTTRWRLDDHSIICWWPFVLRPLDNVFTTPRWRLDAHSTTFWRPLDVGLWPLADVWMTSRWRLDDRPLDKVSMTTIWRLDDHSMTAWLLLDDFLRQFYAVLTTTWWRLDYLAMTFDDLLMTCFNDLSTIFDDHLLTENSEIFRIITYTNFYDLFSFRNLNS